MIRRKGLEPCNDVRGRRAVHQTSAAGVSGASCVKWGCAVFTSSRHFKFWCLCQAGSYRFASCARCNQAHAPPSVRLRMPPQAHARPKDHCTSFAMCDGALCQLPGWHSDGSRTNRTIRDFKIQIVPGAHHSQIMIYITRNLAGRSCPAQGWTIGPQLHQSQQYLVDDRDC